MNTEHYLQPGPGKATSLNSSEAVNLRRPKNNAHLEIVVKKGMIRLGATKTDNTNDLTLAFACSTETCAFNYPENIDIKIEALIDATYIVQYSNQAESKGHDSIIDWILQLHIVRLETNSERRIMKLFQLLTTRLGKRTSEGLLLEYSLSHSRIAEMVGSTRSTVSRTISSLRKANKIYIDELRNHLILPVD